MKWMNGWLTDWIPHNITLLCRLCWWLFEILITMQIYVHWRWFTGKSVSHTPATWVPVAVMQLHHLNTSSDTHSSLRVQCTTSITSVVSSVVPLDFRETQTEEATIIIIIGQQKSQRLITICMKPLRNINRTTRKDHRLNVCLAARPSNSCPTAAKLNPSIFPPCNLPCLPLYHQMTMIWVNKCAREHLIIFPRPSSWRAPSSYSCHHRHWRSSTVSGLLLPFHHHHSMTADGRQPSRV